MNEVAYLEMKPWLVEVVEQMVKDHLEELSILAR
jgi:hypothetical protein